MSIRNNNRLLFKAIEHMLQGIPFWMAYKMECYAGHPITEGVAVDAAVSILNAHIDHSIYAIKCECQYKEIAKSVQKDLRADVAIFNRETNTCECVIEFKLSTNTNGVLEDIKKLSALPESISRMVVLLFQKERPRLSSLFLCGSGVAKRTVSLGENYPLVSTIRATYAQNTRCSNLAEGRKRTKKGKIYRALCIELKSMKRKTNIAHHVKELDERIQTLKEEQDTITLCLSPGATIVETIDPKRFIARLYEMVEQTYNVLGDDIVAQKLKTYQGRPIFRWDVRGFRKDAAIDTMYRLSMLSKAPKPIIIFENITEIPDGDRGTYDDPVLVENELLHSWKNDVIHLTNAQKCPFELNRADYTVIFPVLPGAINKLRHSIRGEMAVVTF